MSRSIRFSSALLLFALAVTTVFAAGKKLKDGDVDVLAEWFAGVYDTAPQPGSNSALGNTLAIERVSSPMIGWHVFYMEERNGNNEAIAEQLIALELAKDKKSIVARSFSFKDPRRWEDGLQRPDIFKSIILDDLMAASGCEIYWFRDKGGFAGKSLPGTCRLRARATGMSMQYNIAVKLTPGEYIYGDRTFSKRAAGIQQ